MGSIKACLTCNSIRRPHSGPHAGALKCLVRSQYRSPTWCCDLWGPRPSAATREALAALGNGRTARSEARTERPASEAANSSFFEADALPGNFHQRRSSTADESGLPD